MILLITDDTQKEIFEAIARAAKQVLRFSEQDKEVLQKHGLKYETDGMDIGPDLTLEQRVPELKRAVASQYVEIPMGFVCGISFEEQPEPLGLCKHLSVSLHDGKHAPHPIAFEEIARLFGMMQKGYPRHTWVEEYDHRKRAINMVEPVRWDGDPVEEDE